MFQLTFAFFFVLVGGAVISLFTGNVEALRVVDRQFEDPRLKRKYKELFLINVVKYIPIFLGALVGIMVLMISASFLEDIDIPQMMVLSLAGLAGAGFTAWLSAKAIRRWAIPMIQAWCKHNNDGEY